jgi:predicted outer membrane repeat protein
VIDVYFYCSNDGEPVLDGFTITGGNADGAYRDNQGGGIYVNYSKIRITACKFINNTAGYGTSGNGGAMAFQNSRVIFTGCEFIRNSAGKDGGAVHMDGCGTCNDSYAEFKDCRFINNYACNDGGALFSTSNTVTNLLNCIIAGNFAGGCGGGLYNAVYSEFPTSVSNCVLTGNWARYGGAVYEGQEWYYSYTTLLNSIVWDNGIDEIRSSGTIATYCDVKGGWPGTGNIDADPLFVEAGYWADVDNPRIVVEPDDERAVWIDGDEHLQAGSPCIGAGDPAYVAVPSGGEIPTEYYFPNPWVYAACTSETDLDGQPRLVGDRVDMGVYEFRQVMSAEARIVPQNINLSGSGKWITCYIRLPEGCDVTDIDPGSIRLEDTIRPLWMWFDEARQVAMFKFKRSDVQSALGDLEPGDVELLVSGEMNDGTIFEATAVIKIVGKSRQELIMPRVFRIR